MTLLAVINAGEILRGASIQPAGHGRINSRISEDRDNIVAIKAATVQNMRMMIKLRPFQGLLISADPHDR